MTLPQSVKPLDHRSDQDVKQPVQSPLVSIITPCYNASLTLTKTVDSIRAQSHTDWELLLVDDCSTDDTCAKAKDYCNQDPRIRLIQQEHNGGGAVARNKGIHEAKGRYIAFLDADDTWLPHKLERQLAHMQNNNWALCYTGYTRINSTGDTLSEIGVPERLAYHDLLKTNYIGCSTAIYDTAVLSRVYAPDLRKRQDFGLWLRILKKTSYAYGINEIGRAHV